MKKIWTWQSGGAKLPKPYLAYYFMLWDNYYLLYHASFPRVVLFNVILSYLTNNNHLAVCPYVFCMYEQVGDIYFWCWSSICAHLIILVKYSLALHACMQGISPKSRTTIGVQAIILIAHIYASMYEKTSIVRDLVALHMSKEFHFGHIHYFCSRSTLFSY
jgi:hypothetical protein